jgi:hypothetical protein
VWSWSKLFMAPSHGHGAQAVTPIVKVVYVLNCAIVFRTEPCSASSLRKTGFQSQPAEATKAEAGSFTLGINWELTGFQGQRGCFMNLA